MRKLIVLVILMAIFSIAVSQADRLTGASNIHSVEEVFTTPGTQTRVRIIIIIIVYDDHIDIWIIFSRVAPNGGNLGTGQDYSSKISQKITGKINLRELGKKYLLVAQDNAARRYDQGE